MALATGRGAHLVGTVRIFADNIEGRLLALRSDGAIMRKPYLTLLADAGEDGWTILGWEKVKIARNHPWGKTNIVPFDAEDLDRIAKKVYGRCPGFAAERV